MPVDVENRRVEYHRQATIKSEIVIPFITGFALSLLLILAVRSKIEQKQNYPTIENPKQTTHLIILRSDPPIFALDPRIYKRLITVEHSSEENVYF